MSGGGFLLHRHGEAVVIDTPITYNTAIDIQWSPGFAYGYTQATSDPNYDPTYAAIFENAVRVTFSFELFPRGLYTLSDFELGAVGGPAFRLSAAYANAQIYPFSKTGELAAHIRMIPQNQAVPVGGVPLPDGTSGTVAVVLAWEGLGLDESEYDAFIAWDIDVPTPPSWFTPYGLANSPPRYFAGPYKFTHHAITVAPEEGSTGDVVTVSGLDFGTPGDSPALTAKLRNTSGVAFSLSSPADVAWYGHGFSEGGRVEFTTSGGLPDGIERGVTIAGPATPGVVQHSGSIDPLENNSRVRFRTTGGLPSPLQAGVAYYVRNRSSTSFELALTKGGAAINVTAPGSGVHHAWPDFVVRNPNADGFNVSLTPSGPLASASDPESGPHTATGLVALTSVVHVSGSQFSGHVPTLLPPGAKSLYIWAAGSPNRAGEHPANPSSIEDQEDYELGSMLTYDGTVNVYAVTPANLERFKLTPMTITGANFEDGASVQVDGLSAATNVVVVDANTITCVSPGMPRGLYAVKVTSPRNGHDEANAYWYTKATILGAAFLVRFPAGEVAAPVASRSIVTRSARVNATDAGQFAAGPHEAPDLWDASAAGLPDSRNHRHQLFEAAALILASLAAEHGPDDYQSAISILGIRDVQRVTTRVAVAPPRGAQVLARIAAHGANPVTAFHTLHTPVVLDAAGAVTSRPAGDTAYTSTALAFDDASIYVLARFEEEVVNGANEYTATHDAFLFEPGETDTLPPVAALDFARVEREGYTIGPEAYDSARGNAEAQLAAFEAEHDLPSGRHRVPFSRWTGYERCFDAMVDGPSAIGGRVEIEIDDAPRTSFYLWPYVKGNPGSGVFSCTLAFSRTRVLACIERITAGSTNAVRLVGFKVSDS